MENYEGIDLEHFGTQEIKAEEKPTETPAVTELVAVVQPVQTMSESALSLDYDRFTFEFSPTDKDKLKDFMHFAYRLNLIPKENVDEYIKFCLNVAADFIIKKSDGL